MPNAVHATPPAYSPITKLLHWGVLALMAVQYAVGFLMPHIGRDTANEGLVSWHLSVGTAILFVMLLRIVWRGAHPEPMPALTPAWQHGLAKATHWAIYLLVIVNPVLGWAAANYRGWDVVLFGVVTLPPLAAEGTAWAHTAGDVHITLIYVLLGALALHVGGALYHHFIQRDDVLRRMMP